MWVNVGVNVSGVGAVCYMNICYGAICECNTSHEHDEKCVVFGVRVLTRVVFFHSTFESTRMRFVRRFVLRAIARGHVIQS